MGVIIVGGNECMVCQYENICKKHGCNGKVFVKEKANFGKKIGNAELMVLFTNTVSHRMVKNALEAAKKNNIQVERLHTSSATALNNLLAAYCG